MTMPRGAGARTARSQRRAARADETGVSKARVVDPEPLVAAPMTISFETNENGWDSYDDEQLRDLGAFVRDVVLDQTARRRVADAIESGEMTREDGDGFLALRAVVERPGILDASVEYAADDVCAKCSHGQMAHADGEGACSVDGCMCEGYAAEDGDLTASVRLEITSLVASGASIYWEAVFCPEGTLTDDGRAFAPGSISWRELPLSLMAMTETSEIGHVGAEIAGRIDRIWRDEEANLIRASGVFDAGEYGQEIARLVDEKVLRGLSVDIAVRTFEFGPESDYFDEDGDWAPQEKTDESENEDGFLDALFADDVIFVVTAGVIGAATVCPFPAFAEASIEVADTVVAGGNPAVWTVRTDAGWRLTGRKPKTPLVASAVLDAANDALARGETRPLGDVLAEIESEETLSGESALVAGLAPETPPAWWFDDPGFEEPTPINVDDSGRVFGHAATWDVCHIGLPLCQTAPHSNANYAYFHLGEVVCDDGSRVECGQITINGPHAGLDLGRVEATAHYDHTGTAVADVVVGEDEHGIWVAGAVRPSADADLVRALRGSKLSGDWRGVNGNRELVALLAVNVPGFPVPRSPKAAVSVTASGELEVTSLVGAGILGGPTATPEIDRRTVERFAALAAMAEFDAIAAEVG